MSLLLALLLVASLGAPAFAADYTDMSTVTLTVTYNEANDGSTSPSETLAFTIKPASVTDSAEGVTAGNMPVPTLGAVAYNQGAAGNAGEMAKALTITLPSYDNVGIYTYTIKQTAGTNAGEWYLPSIGEARRVFGENYKIVSAALNNVNGDYIGLQWTSTQTSASCTSGADYKMVSFDNPRNICSLNFSLGKSSCSYQRCVRNF